MSADPLDSSPILSTLVAVSVPKRRFAAALLLGGAVCAAAANLAADPLPPASPSLAAFQVTLANGITFEVTGLCEPSSPDRTWWRADGSPIPESSEIGILLRKYALTDPVTHSGRPGDLIREIVLRTFLVPSGITVLSPRLEDQAQILRMSGEGRRENGKTVNVDRFHARLRSAARTDIFFDYSDDPWRAYATYDPANRAHENGEDMVVLFSEPSEKDGGTSISVSHDQGQETRALRLVALDLKQRVHEPSRSGQQGEIKHHGLICMMDAVFENLPLNRIARIELQFRKFHHVEFRNVSLHRGQMSRVEVLVDGKPYHPAKAK